MFLVGSLIFAVPQLSLKLVPKLVKGFSATNAHLF